MARTTSRAAGRSYAHVPPLQLPAHLLPQNPQLLLSVLRSTQTPEQSSRLFQHSQLPWLHDEPEGHACPQVPQFCRSESVVTH